MASVCNTGITTNIWKNIKINDTVEKSEKGFVAALLLCFFLGVFGVHRFYAGKILSGVAMLFTLGGLGIWALVDLIIIVTGGFKDKHGLAIKSA